MLSFNVIYFASALASVVAGTELKPSQPLTISANYGEAVKFDVSTLGEFCKSCTFEVRLSYPATLPSSFTFRLTEADDEDAISAAFARKLMNTERFFISTGPEGGILSALHERTLDRPTLLVRADSAGMRRSSDNRYDGSVDYVIIAELLVGGVVPAERSVSSRYLS